MTVLHDTTRAELDEPLPEAPRLIDVQEGQPSPGIVRIGHHHPGWRDVYHFLLTVRWHTFLVAILLSYMAVNMLFASLYLWGGENIAEAKPGSFSDAFYFSVQTMATIGYGRMYPQTDFANILVTIEAMIGTMSLALASALMFARLARPSARVLFSKVAVVAVHDGEPALMFRAVSKRQNQILDASVVVTLLRSEITAEGEPMLRFHDLHLVRARSPVFALPWTVIHTIDAQSPLTGHTRDSLAAEPVEIVIVLSGFDDSFSQQVHAHHSYVGKDIRWNARFVNIVGKSRRGSLRIDFRRFHQVAPVADSAVRAEVT